jgi:hypothetical protein
VPDESKPCEQNTTRPIRTKVQRGSNSGEKQTARAIPDTGPSHKEGAAWRALARLRRAATDAFPDLPVDNSVGAHGGWTYPRKGVLGGGTNASIGRAYPRGVDGVRFLRRLAAVPVALADALFPVAADFARLLPRIVRRVTARIMNR